MADLSASNFSTTDASNNAASPNGWAVGTMLPSQVEPTMQATTGALKRFWERVNCQVTTTGASGTYVYAPTNISFPSSIVQGEVFGFYSHQAAAGNDTFKINGTTVLGPYNIYIVTQQSIRQIRANEILNGQFCMMQYSTSLAAIILLNPATVSSNSPTFTGTVGMSGATVVTVPTVATTDNSTNAASTAYVTQKAFQAVLPAQIAGFLGSDGSTASFSRAINEYEDTIASAATPDIWTGTGNVINYTGTATATGFAAAPRAGSRRTLVCAGAAVFTAGANMLIDGITSGSNYVASANDRIYVTALSTTQFLLEPRKANGTSVIAVPRGYMNGFTLSNDGTLPNTVLDIAAGSAIDSTNATTITGTAFTKSTAGVWAAGSGANGMGQGLTIANSTWYHVFAIINNGAFDVYFDTSISAANKPANTTAYRRIGSFKTNGSAQIIPFTQYGQLILWATQVVELNGAAPASATLLAITVPPDLNMRPLLSAIVQANAAPAGRFYEVWSPVLGSGDREQFSLYEQAASANISGNCNTVVTNTSRQVYHRNPGAALGNVILYTQGWIDQSIASVS